MPIMAGAPDMSWTQTRGLSRDPNLTEGLEARLADPLWMLNRQRQFGALQGEDAASPVQVHIETEEALVDKIQLGKEDFTDLDSDAPPIEPFVEADPVAQTPGWERARIEAALDLLARMPDGLADELRHRLQEDSPLDLPKLGDRVLDRLRLRAFDPELVQRKGRKAFGDHVGSITTDQAARTAAGVAFDAWVAMLSDRFIRPKVGGGLWADRRFDYSFTLRASKRDANLVAKGYDGGRFDWYSVDIESPKESAFQPKKGTPTDPLVTRMRYPGMPSRRFWDFEDYRVNFGGMELGLSGLPQTLLVEFATIYSDDWYVAPLRVPTGSMSRVTKVQVRDVFGDKRDVQSAAQKDGEGRSWRFFELTGDKSVGVGSVAPWLYMPRVVTGGHEGKPVEEVSLRRDEAANLAWAIETKIETAASKPLNRATLWARARAELAAIAPPTDLPSLDEDDWVYLLETQSPPYWVPFAPGINAKGYPNGRLDRRRLSAWERWPAEFRRLAGPQSMMIAPGGAFSIDEATLPRSGLVLTRSYQVARRPDGRVMVWATRRKRPAGTELSGTREVDLLMDIHGQPLDQPVTRKAGNRGGSS